MLGIDDWAQRAYLDRAVRDLDVIQAAVVVDATGPAVEEAGETIGSSVRATNASARATSRRESPNLAIVSVKCPRFLACWHRLIGKSFEQCRLRVMADFKPPGTIANLSDARRQTR